MRMYIVAGAVGSGIFDVVSELWEELFSRGFRTSRLVYGRPDRIDLNSIETAEEVIARIENDIENRVSNNDFILTGSQAALYHKEIRTRWPDQSKIIFVRKTDNIRAIEAGLCLLESHVEYNRAAYTEWMQVQVDNLNTAVEELGVSWTDVEVNNMFTIQADKLTESDDMLPDLILCNEYTGPKSEDCVLRQIAIY